MRAFLRPPGPQPRLCYTYCCGGLLEARVRRRRRHVPPLPLPLPLPLTPPTPLLTKAACWKPSSEDATVTSHRSELSLTRLPW